MQLYNIALKTVDYYNTYTDVAFWLAECRASSKKVIAFVPEEGTSLNKFLNYTKKALLEFKKAGILEVYLRFSELQLDKTASKYLLNKFPYLSSEVDTEKPGFIVKL